MSQRKIFIAIGVLVFVAMTLVLSSGLIKNYALNQEDQTLRKVFGLSGATLREIQLNQWLQITEFFGSNKSAEEYTEQVGKKIFGSNPYETKNNEEADGYSQITLTGFNKPTFTSNLSAHG